MEDSFRVRVDKVFGSLSSAVTPSLWTLTDEEIEKKEWNRDPPIHPYDDDDPQPPPGLIASSKPDTLGVEDEDQDEDQDVEEAPSASSQRADRHNRLRRASATQNPHEDDELEVRASIGLDCTLDYEDEEDEFDKVAVGKEKSGERLYMKDINDYDTDFNDYVTDVHNNGTDVNTSHELSVGLDDGSRDPRANHLAAKLRLKEDSEAAGGFDSLKLSETSQGIPNSLSSAEADIASPSVNIGSQDDGDGGSTNPKPILKNKRDHRVSKSLKRVRFEPQIDTTSDTTRDQNQEDQEDQEDQEASNLALTKTGDSLISSSATTMDRSKYTHYTLDSSDELDAESNRKAYMDFLNSIKKPDTTEMQLDDDFSKPPTFTSKKSSMLVGDSKSKNDGTFPVCIAAEDVLENKISAMEEDDSPVVDRGVYKSGRQYRTKSKIDIE